MTAGSGAARARLGGLAVALAGLAGCTTGGVPAGASPGAPSPADTAVPPVDETAATDGPRPATTDVVLSGAFWNAADGVLEAGGYVSPVVEESGTCLLELRQGAETVTVSTPGLPDASTTVCGGLQTEPGALAAGRWTVVLRYRSETTSGSSAPLDVEVPS